ncbi:carbohydrate ABC transporter permease [Nesterenkonia xinjiangensis]|uniref:Multiple sugar transport system permease protein n=1 Tax=Nesterenkonia xinjiangensis TaxID=225327 RepID=A0A7Z0KBE7_9MICC|nr:sugar ABC transporter permease [Nesterenkonia xinjiangensis]NYJ79220.1 multiple sugar transport system permease protein [Nesterenkonia xinjiangensis]
MSTSTTARREARTRTRRAPSSSRRLPQGLRAWLRALPFMGPHLVLFAVFGLIPAVFGIYVAFTQWNLVGDPEFIGLDNFRVLFDTDHAFHRIFINGLWNTILFVIIGVPLLIGVPLVLAVLLSRKDLRAANVFQGIFFVPGLISVSAGAIAWNLVFNREFGPVNHYLGTDISFTTTQPWAWGTIFVLTIWAGIGGNLIIYRSAISAVPQELYEVASIDGAGAARSFINVTLPSIRLPLLYTTVMTTTASFNVFAQPLMLTNGGPADSTTVLMMEVRDLAFGGGPSIAGVASAMAVLLGLVLMAISAIQFFIMYRRTDV